MRRIGIDPGKTGAIAAIGNTSVEKYTTPLVGKEFDLSAFEVLLLQYKGDPNVHVCIEDVHAVFGSAAGATFSFGFVCGAIQGIVSALRIPFTLVQPKMWQKEMYQGIPEIRKPDIKIKKGKRVGQSMKGKRDTKAMSLLAAKRLFPNVDLRASERCRIPHDGIVDALLLAEYCRRKFK